MSKDLKEIGSLHDVNFQCDDNNNLYVNGKKVMTEKRVLFRGLELFILSVTASSVFIQAVFAVLEFMK